MMSAPLAWPDGLAPDVACLTVDVEWAHPVVLADLVALFDAAGVSATVFVTHPGVTLPGHERGLHPNFRRDGDTHRALTAARPPGSVEATDDDVHRFVLERTLAFAPEAQGVRTHSLYADSTLLPHFKRLGLSYDCTARLPLVAGLRPVWQQHDVLAIPTYYADHFDLMTGATGFQIGGLRLDRPGLKVFDFHPNMIYLNSADDAHYQASKAFYDNPDRLLAARRAGRGVRTLLLDLLEEVAAGRVHAATVGEVNRLWRTLPQVWG